MPSPLAHFRRNDSPAVQCVDYLGAQVTGPIDFLSTYGIDTLLGSDENDKGTHFVDQTVRRFSEK